MKQSLAISMNQKIQSYDVWVRSCGGKKPKKNRFVPLVPIPHGNKRKHGVKENKREFWRTYKSKKEILKESSELRCTA